MKRLRARAFRYAGRDWGTNLKMCLPAVRKLCIEQPPQALVQLYVGFISAAFGAMTADFGADAAEDLIRHCMTALDGIEEHKNALH